MKKIIILFIALIFLVPAASASAQNVSTGISISNGELQSFYLAVGDYYRVPESRVVYVRDHYRIRDEELPVVFFLASRAHVDPYHLPLWADPRDLLCAREARRPPLRQCLWPLQEARA